MATGKKVLAVYDFDGTLYRGDSFIGFALAALGLASVALATARTAPWLAAWRLGLCSNSAAKQRLFGNLYGGMDAGDFARLCRGFARVIDAHLLAAQQASMSGHIQAGHTVCILSASPSAWIEPWAMARGVDMVIGTCVEVRGGRLTGRFASANCHGAHKAARLREAFPGLDGYEVWCYADSPSDSAVMALADHRVWVGR